MYPARGQLRVLAVNQQTPVNFLYLEAKFERTSQCIVRPFKHLCWTNWPKYLHTRGISHWQYPHWEQLRSFTIGNAMSIFKTINSLDYSAIHELDMVADHYSFSLWSAQSQISKSSCKVVGDLDFPCGPIGGVKVMYSQWVQLVSHLKSKRG